MSSSLAAGTDVDLSLSCEYTPVLNTTVVVRVVGENTDSLIPSVWA